MMALRYKMRVILAQHANAVPLHPVKQRVTGQPEQLRRATLVVMRLFQRLLKRFEIDAPRWELIRSRRHNRFQPLRQVEYVTGSRPASCVARPSTLQSFIKLLGQEDRSRSY
jgi:hypothetical protein